MGQTKLIKVLLVDDELEFVETLCERLIHRGFEADFARGGEEALRKIRANQYDVVVLDVLMPDKNGIQVYSEIQAIDPLIHVIVLTGHAKIETAIDGMKAGIYDYLIKPVRLEDLITKLEMAHRHRAVFEERLLLKKQTDH